MSDRRWGLVNGNRNPIGVMGILVAASALAVTADQFGIIGGALLLVTVTLPPPYVVAVGHVLLVALNPTGVTPIALVIVEAGLLTTLVDVGAGQRRAREIIGILTGIGLIVGVVWASLRWGTSPWTSVGALGLLVALGSYGLHRYELVWFDLIEAE